MRCRGALGWLAAMLLLTSAAALADDTLIGWQGEQYRDPGTDHRRVRTFSPSAARFKCYYPRATHLPHDTPLQWRGPPPPTRSLRGVDAV